MKWLVVLVVVFGCGGMAYSADEDKIIRMNGQIYKIWTDKNGVRRIDPVYLIEKAAPEVAVPVGKGAAVATPDRMMPGKIEEADIGSTVVEDMDYQACRQSLVAAESIAMVYNVVFDYPKASKFTVLMVVDDKTVQLKCEYGTRVTTTWDQ